MVLSYYHAGGPWQYTPAPGRHDRLPHPPPPLPAQLRPTRGMGERRSPGTLARGGLPLRYARDLAPARCRFRSTRFLPFGGALLPPYYPQPPGVSPRLASGPRPTNKPCGAFPVRTLHRGASALSVHGLFRNGTRDAGRSFPGGRSSADLRVHRKASDEVSDPPPRMRKPIKGALASGRAMGGAGRRRRSERTLAGVSQVEPRSEGPRRTR